MPKLIIKQNDGAASQQSKISTWLSVGGLLILLIAVAAGAFFFTKTPLPGAELEPLTFSSSGDEGSTKNYQSMHAILGDLMVEYEGLAARGVDDYQKNLMLLGKAESILGHLDKMDGVSAQLKLNEQEYGEVTDRHQFYKDFWQAKLHFRELRVSRFEVPKNGADDATESSASVQATQDQGEQVAESIETEVVKAEEDEVADSTQVEAAPLQDIAAEDAQAETTSTQAAQDTVTEETQIKESTPSTPTKKFQFAKPPEGMEMPAGFCDLSDPAASCKPGEEDMLADDGASDLSLPPLGENDLALPPVDENDLALPGDLTLPEEGQLAADENMAPAHDEVGDTSPKKPKFQFAKPPEGMEMPAGFCDLSDPAASCKPGEEDMLADDGASDLSLPNDLALPDDLALPPVDGNDLALPDDLSLPPLPEDALPLLDDLALPPLPEDELPLPADDLAVLDSNVQPKKPKFQFAKPPEGMEMPAGFCDLSDPAASCKPGEDHAAGDGGLDLALPPIDENDLALPDDLALPSLPEGDLLSDVDQPVLKGETELDSTDKSQL